LYYLIMILFVCYYILEAADADKENATPTTLPAKNSINTSTTSFTIQQKA